MKLTASKRVGRLEVNNARSIERLAEEERKKKEEETREVRNKEAEARQWLMLLHYYEDNSGPCADDAKVMLKRILKHVNEYGEPDIEKMSTEERAFWCMFDEVFNCIGTDCLVTNEIDYQLDKLLGEEGAQKFRTETTYDDLIRFLDKRLGPSWRAIQYEYPPREPLNIDPETAQRFLRGQQAVKEVTEGNWTGS